MYITRVCRESSEKYIYSDGSSKKKINAIIKQCKQAVSQHSYGAAGG
jgi:hypothetical protein